MKKFDLTFNIDYEACYFKERKNDFKIGENVGKTKQIKLIRSAYLNVNLFKVKDLVVTA
jgi:hypothetical protein